MASIETLSDQNNVLIKLLTEDDDIDGEKTQIHHLPFVIFEYILSHLSPYRDLLECKLVSKPWRYAVISTIDKLKRDFVTSLTTMSIEWEHYNPCGGPSISPRYSHSACCIGDSVYIFGGCTIANTTFNDLWRFDLSQRCWIRPIATGTFPSPKACASFVNSDDCLILFGGWSHSSPYPIHQEWRLFNHVHVFNTKTNRWTLMETHSYSPAIAGHSASVVNDEMIVFGGLQTEVNSATPFSSSNDIWVLNLKSWTWRRQITSNIKPLPRYGHSQLVIDSHHLMIIGGCGGPNMLFSDIWLLSIPNDPLLPWEWKMIEVIAKDNALTPPISFHPSCKIGDIIVVFGGTQKSRIVQCKDGQLLRKPSVRNQYVSTGQESNHTNTMPKLISQQSSSSSAQSSERSHPQQNACDQQSSTSSTSLRPNSRRNRQRQIEGLNRMEQRIKQLKGQTLGFSPLPIKSATIRTVNNNSPSNPMQMFVLDISKVIETHSVTWIQQINDHINQGPEEIILYTLVPGRAEIIMFGGIQKDKNMKQIQQDNSNNVPDIVSNELHIISAKKVII